jgi:hypothetical protein
MTVMAGEIEIREVLEREDRLCSTVILAGGR